MTTLQGQIQSTASRMNTLEQRLNQIQQGVTPSWPVITKFAFRELLTPIQEMVWDNYDLLKEDLTLSNEQFMAIRTLRARFDSAEKITMTDQYLIAGLHNLVTWGLTLNGEPVFTTEEVDRILAGQPVVTEDPETGPEV
jgi:hypothetical protein